MSQKNPTAFAEDGVYTVKLTRPVMLAGRGKFLPLPEHEMSGRVLNEIVAQEGGDVVDRADPR